MRLRRVLVWEELWVAEVASDYGDERVFHYVSIVELKDGKMWRDTRYYAEPSEAPEWRAQWSSGWRPKVLLDTRVNKVGRTTRGRPLAVLLRNVELPEGVAEPTFHASVGKPDRRILSGPR